MTNLQGLLALDDGQPATAVHLVDPASFDASIAGSPASALLTAQGFKPQAGSHAIVPGINGAPWSVIAVVADTADLGKWCLAGLVEHLPAGTYRLVVRQAGRAALGWLLAQYRFDRYRSDERPTGPRVLLVDADTVADATAEAHAVALVRDLVNTPTSDMGPPHLEAETRRLAAMRAADVRVTSGDELARGFPMIAAVGRAADQAFAPRLIELEWGDPTHPRIAIVGKGVCFDSGGLDIKPSAGMRLMKKDMGGAAHALALAQLIMAAGLPVRLHLLIPAVENAISGNAFRPGDILNSRGGKTVEIANTDAEGRLVLADALTKAGEAAPELIIDFATLTGAARVALGPDLPALFCNDDRLATDAVAAGVDVGDPVWRLPLHAGYADMLKSDIADLNNAPEGGFAGAVTAALFLEKFVPPGTPWLHLDTFAWRPVAKPGRPKGGEALGLLAIWAMLQRRYGS